MAQFLVIISYRCPCEHYSGTVVLSTANWTSSDPSHGEVGVDYDFHKCCFDTRKMAPLNVARCPFTSMNRHAPVQMGSTVTHLLLFCLILFLLWCICQYRALIYICFVSLPLCGPRNRVLLS